MNDRYLDFDAARAERLARKGRTFVKAFGREWPVPSSPPLEFTLELARLQAVEGDDKSLDTLAVIRLIESAVGRDTLNGFRAEGAEEEDLEDLLRLVTGAWGGTGVDPSGEGSAPDPE